MRTALVWFRRDLRVHDHPALTAAARSMVAAVYRKLFPWRPFEGADPGTESA
jgi:deoxyribodipyrimidine photolyase